MNYVITVINPESLELLTTICASQKLSIVTAVYGEGTADESIRSLFGITYSLEKRVVLAIADEAATKKLLKAQKRYLDIDAPGHGMTAVLPIRSVGSKSFLSYLTSAMETPTKGEKPEGSQKEPEMNKPDLNSNYELIFCIANNGATDAVMTAARKAGAHGGTVIHGKGTGDKNTPRFYNVTISSEKEIVMILARKDIRNPIMQSILQEAGPATDAGAIVFSLPVTAVAGIDEHDSGDDIS